MLTLIIIVLLLLWLSGYFGPPVVPAIALPTLSLHLGPYLPVLYILLVIVVIIVLLR